MVRVPRTHDALIYINSGRITNSACIEVDDTSGWTTYVGDGYYRATPTFVCCCKGAMHKRITHAYTLRNTEHVVSTCIHFPSPLQGVSHVFDAVNDTINPDEASDDEEVA
jgi:hypothetical protein